MGLSFLGGLKGFADGVNAEAAYAQQAKLAHIKSTAATRANLKLTTDADILSRTKSLGRIPVTVNGINTMYDITYLESDADSAEERNIQNASNIMDATTLKIGGKSVMEWIDLNGDITIANNVVNNFGRYMHPVIRETVVKADNGSFVTQVNFPHITDTFWMGITKRMVTNNKAKGVLPGDLLHLRDGRQDQNGSTIFNAIKTNVAEYGKSYWKNEGII